jgi:hypothetical protein
MTVRTPQARAWILKEDPFAADLFDEGAVEYEAKADGEPLPHLRREWARISRFYRSTAVWLRDPGAGA